MKRIGVVKEKPKVAVNNVRSHIFRTVDAILDENISLPLFMVGSKTGDILKIDSNPKNKTNQTSLKTALEGLFSILYFLLIHVVVKTGSLKPTSVGILFLFVICRRYLFSLRTKIETKEEMSISFSQSFEKYFKDLFDEASYDVLRSSLADAVSNICEIYDDKIKKIIKSENPKNEDFLKKTTEIYENLLKKWKLNGFDEQVLLLEDVFFSDHSNYFKNANYNVFESELVKVCISLP
jgi:hypothetical protein